MYKVVVTTAKGKTLLYKSASEYTFTYLSKKYVNVEFFPIDGRTKRARKLPWISAECLSSLIERK